MRQIITHAAIFFDAGPEAWGEPINQPMDRSTESMK